MSALVRLGNYISTKQGFLRATMIGLGIPAAAAFGAWTFHDYGEVASLFAIPAAMVGAYLWGLIMWRLVFHDLYARKQAIATEAKTPSHAGKHDSLS